MMKYINDTDRLDRAFRDHVRRDGFEIEDILCAIDVGEIIVANVLDYWDDIPSTTRASMIDYVVASFMAWACPRNDRPTWKHGSLAGQLEAWVEEDKAIDEIASMLAHKAVQQSVTWYRWFQKSRHLHIESGRETGSWTESTHHDRNVRSLFYGPREADHAGIHDEAACGWLGSVRRSNAPQERRIDDQDRLDVIDEHIEYADVEVQLLWTAFRQHRDESNLQDRLDHTITYRSPDDGHVYRETLREALRRHETTENIYYIRQKMKRFLSRLSDVIEGDI